jgi:hypothetical protein
VFKTFCASFKLHGLTIENNEVYFGYIKGKRYMLEELFRSNLYFGNMKDPRDSKYWHRRLPGEQNSRSQASAENLGKLYYRTM